MTKKNKLFVLSGPSGSGKSSLLAKIVKEGLCEQAPKYSNREKRSTEFDDITHIRLEDFKEKCDIIYKRYNICYGVNTEEIKERLKHFNQIVIISDITVMEILKKHLGKDVLIVFIYLQDFCIDNLLKERYKLQLEDRERKNFADHILMSRDIGDKKWLNSVPEEIIKKLRENFPNSKKYHEFVKRCNSWIELNIDYKKNEKLFTDTISGATIDELFNKFNNQIFNKKYSK
jgi:guanylate kinase